MTTATTAIGGGGLVASMVAIASRSIRMMIVTVYAMVGSRSRDINKNEGISRGGLFPQLSPQRGPRPPMRLATRLPPLDVC